MRASQIPELQSFVQSIKRDKAAVLAGLTLPHNNGVVEGKVNKLKRDLAHDVRKGRLPAVTSACPSCTVRTILLLKQVFRRNELQFPCRQALLSSHENTTALLVLPDFL